MPGYFTPERRRRLAPLVLGGGLLVVGKLAGSELPHDQEVRLLLSPAQREARSVAIDYAQGSEQVGGVQLRFAEGAPAEVAHTPSLSPGRYELAIRLSYADGHVEQLARSLSVPAEGAARIRLSPSP